MHLKVCANPACGKVSDVAATVCETCGEPFPKVALVAPGAADATPPASGSIVDMEAPEKPRTALWPLIAVAVVAGSLPLLWANRAYLPAPKSGPFSNPDVVKPAPAPVVTAPAPLPITPPPASPPPVSAAATPPVPVAPAAASEIDPAGPAPSTKSTDKPKKATKPAPHKKAAAKRPCTEALAALGLCEPAQAGK